MARKEMLASLASMASPDSQEGPVGRAPRATLACRVSQELLATRDLRVPKEESETKDQMAGGGTLVMLVPRELVGSLEIREYPDKMVWRANKAHREPRDRRERLELR